MTYNQYKARCEQIARAFERRVREPYLEKVYLRYITQFKKEENNG